jgi:hypothetical protein
MNRETFSEPPTMATRTSEDQADNDMTDPADLGEDVVRDTPAEPHLPEFVPQHLEGSPEPARWLSEADVFQDHPDNDMPTEGNSGGRISNLNHEILEEGFLQLDTLIVDLSERTGLPQKQISNLWDKWSKASTSANRFHSWVSYQKYFKAHEKEELTREYGQNRPQKLGTYAQ